MSAARDEIVRRAIKQGSSEAFGVLLHSVALLLAWSDVEWPESTVEASHWNQISRGMRHALVCLAVYERDKKPHEANMLVGRALMSAVKIVENERQAP